MLCADRRLVQVPFARYVAMNRVKYMKRYQIAKVYLFAKRQKLVVGASSTRNRGPVHRYFMV